MTAARRIALLVMVTALLGAPSAVRAAVAGGTPDAVQPLAAGDAADALAIGELAGTVLIAGVSGAVAVVLIGLGVLIGLRPRRRAGTSPEEASVANILHRRLLRRARFRMEADPIVDALLDEPEPTPTPATPSEPRTEPGS